MMKNNNSYTGRPEERVDNNAFTPFIIKALKNSTNLTSQQICYCVNEERTIHHYDLLGVLHYMETKREIKRTGKTYQLIKHKDMIE